MQAGEHKAEDMTGAQKRRKEGGGEAESGLDEGAGDDGDVHDVGSVVFLDIDGVLLPFAPAEEPDDDEFDPGAGGCSLCEGRDVGHAWECDVCRGCFCSACRYELLLFCAVIQRILGIPCFSAVL